MGVLVPFPGVRVATNSEHDHASAELREAGEEVLRLSDLWVEGRCELAAVRDAIARRQTARRWVEWVEADLTERGMVPCL